MRPKYDNPDCSGAGPHSRNMTVRILHTGGGGNAILCRACFWREMSYRRQRIAEGVPFELPSWQSLTIYDPTGDLRPEEHQCQ